MSLTSRPSAVLLATAVAGLAAIGHARSDDDWLAPVATVDGGKEIDCDALPSDEPRDELTILDELVTELRCATIDGPCIPPRCCCTDPD
jgi:hypothetical protein